MRIGIGLAITGQRRRRVDPFDGVQATGGIETVINPEPGKFFRVHTFLESGDLTVTQGGEVEYLVVAGGGSGGSDNPHTPGGGGAGGYWKRVSGELFNNGPLLSLEDGVASITVGDGGPPRPAGVRSQGNDGFHSALGSILEAVGGGGGGFGDTFNVPLRDGRSGGSGGGGGAGNDDMDSFGGSGTPPQGNAGGDAVGTNSTVIRRGGGGGGAGGSGDNAIPNSTTELGNGGPGIFSAISGFNQPYAGGGGGGSGSAINPGIGGSGIGGDGSIRRDENSAATSGTPNTGSGGGAGNRDNPSGAGGSGIVIIRYRITEEEYDAEAA